MCDLSDKLIAWLDHELPQHEAAGLQQHLQVCADCRRCLTAYRQVGQAIHEYCDVALESPARRALPGWAPALSAAAAVVVALLFLHRADAERHPPQIDPSTTARAADPGTHVESTPPAVAAIRPAARRPRVAAPPQIQPARIQNASWIPAEPAVQIAIPAEAMFAPGAFPQGVTFTADLTIAADGSARQLRLRP